MVFLTLIHTFLFSPSTSTFTCTSVCFLVILLAQAFVTTLDALVRITLGVLDWSAMFAGVFVYGMIFGASTVTQEILDCIKGLFIKCAFCLLMTLHGRRGTPGNRRSYQHEGNKSHLALISARTMLEASNRNDNGDKKLPCPLSFAVKSPGHAAGHHQRDRTAQATRTGPSQIIMVTNNSTAVANEVIEGPFSVSTPQQAILSFTQRPSSFVKLDSALPSPPRSPQFRSRSKCATRRIRTRRPNGPCNSIGANGLSGLLYGGYASTPMPSDVTVVARLFTEVTIESIRTSRKSSTSRLPLMEIAGESTAARGIEREWSYGSVLDKLRRLQIILNCDEY